MGVRKGMLLSAAFSVRWSEACGRKGCKGIAGEVRKERKRKREGEQEATREM